MEFSIQLLAIKSGWSVAYRFSGNVMASIIILPKIKENLEIFTPKMQFLSIFNVM